MKTDYKEISEISDDNDFWIRAKSDLIDALLSNVGKHGKILNIGAGTGGEIKILKKYGKVYAIDINPNAVKFIPKRLCEEKKVCDATDIKYPDSSFDIVTSFDVFEHIGDDAKSVEEVCRVLKPRGYLIFTVPAFQMLFSSHDRALEHKRRYGKAALKSLLKNFQILKLGYWNFSLLLPTFIMRMVKDRSVPKLDHMALGRISNSLLYNILKSESILIKKNIPLPIGLTIYGVCRKSI
ncbi:class I SAM-dependent methyltransferase [archaeon]|nr:MAG: class I SAM-dependent methyltransferase [archaeon]